MAGLTAGSGYDGACIYYLYLGIFELLHREATVKIMWLVLKFCGSYIQNVGALFQSSLLLVVNNDFTE